MRVTQVVVAELSAAMLLEQPETACYAAGADAGSWTDAELCDRVVRTLARTNASWLRKHMAVIAAAHRGRYDLFVRAMEKRGMQPIVIEDLVKFGEERGEARGEARGMAGAILTLLAARGVAVDETTRAAINACTDLDRLDRWVRRAATASTADEVLSER